MGFTAAGGTVLLWGTWVRAEPSPWQWLPWDLLGWMFVLGALGGCWDSLGKAWSARPAGRVAGWPCWALCEARGACERGEQVTEVLCVSAAGTGPRAARPSPANELGVLRARACAHSCPEPLPARPRDATSQPRAAEQSSFSSVGPSCRTADRSLCPSCRGRGQPCHHPGPGPGRPAGCRRRAGEDWRLQPRSCAAMPLRGQWLPRVPQAPLPGGRTWAGGVSVLLSPHQNQAPFEQIFPGLETGPGGPGWPGDR